MITLAGDQVIQRRAGQPGQVAVGDQARSPGNVFLITGPLRSALPAAISLAVIRALICLS